MKKFYEERIDWYKEQVDWHTEQIKWYGKYIKQEKYDWGGYSLTGQEYIRQRNYNYRARTKARKQVQKYTTLLQSL